MTVVEASQSPSRTSAGSKLLTISFVLVAACSLVLVWQLYRARTGGSKLAVLRADPVGVEALLETPVPDSAGGTVVLGRSPSRLLVLFAFTPSDCSICLEELSSLESLGAMRQEVEVYALMSYSNPDEAAQTRRNFAIGFPLLQDPDGRLLEGLHVPKTPWKLVIDPRGHRLLYEEPPSITPIERDAFVTRVARLGALGSL